MKKFFCLLLIFLSIFCTYKKNTARAIKNKIILLTEKKGILVSFNGGDSWDSLNEGLPGKFIPTLIKEGPEKNLYLITLQSGIYKLANGNVTWLPINSNEFLQRGKHLKKRYRKISAFAINKDFPDQLALSTKHDIYLSYNGGRNWERVSMKGLHRRNYVTALCIAGKKPAIFAGTSFKGIFKKNKGKFYKFSTGLPVEKYSNKITFYEHVTVIKQSLDGSSILAGFAYGRGMFKSNRNNSWKDLKPPLPSNKQDFVQSIASTKNKYFLSTDTGISVYNIKIKKWAGSNLKNILNKLPQDSVHLSFLLTGNNDNSPSLFFKIKDHKFRIKKLNNSASEKRGIYTNPYSIKKKLNYYIKTIKKHGLNSLVIDMKDDYGYLHFPTRNEIALEIHSAKRPLPVKKILKKLKANNIYAIARVVVFKDRALFRGYNNKYAIKNIRTGKPWKGNPGEYWVDPHSDFVKRYNVEIAFELEKLGFDEIQFDYIRFPTDGATSLCKFSFRKDKNIYKSEVLSEFLRSAKFTLSIPVSVDIYGFNGWYFAGNWMGQDIEEFSYIVDVISPMDYPSHFGNKFYMNGPRNKRSYRIIKAAGLRANRNVNGRVFIRPYLQGFNLISPTWGPEYIRNQVKGANESNCSGFIFWNARGDYSMVSRGLK